MRSIRKDQKKCIMVILLSVSCIFSTNRRTKFLDDAIIEMMRCRKKDEYEKCKNKDDDRNDSLMIKLRCMELKERRKERKEVENISMD
uniref:Uncharacterized protein n=1 Tax=Onchocerca volvulus TaxID=6282 RepID=A0A8R1Y0W1_ONCVO